jgi:DNA (cytosine-5)-methyltransferase 1
MSESCFTGLTFGSVCSGIEAASVAWEPFGWRPVWFSEIEPFPTALLAWRFPDVPNLGDMTLLAARVRAGEIEAPDVLVGGTPCQDFSVAGLRVGIVGARGNLTLSFVELADAIDDRRGLLGLPPCIAVWENVPGVRSLDCNAFGCLLAGLAGDDEPLVPGPRPERGKSNDWWTWRAKLGDHVAKWSVAGAVAGPERAVAWRSFDAQFFGLAQRRERVFVVAGAGEGFDPAAILLEWEGLRRDSAPSREAREEASHPFAPCLTGSGRGVERTGDPRGQDPDDGVLSTGGAAVDEAGDAVSRPGDLSRVADTLEATAAPSRGAGTPLSMLVVEDRIAPTLDASFARLQGCSGQDLRHGHGHGHGHPVTAPRGDPDEAVPQWWDGRDVSQTLDAVLHKGQTMPEKDRFPAVLQPVAANAATGHFAGFCEVDVSDPLRGTGGDAGDGSESLIGEAICVTGSVTHTLKANGFDGSEDGTGRGQPIVAFNPRSTGVNVYVELAGTIDGSEPAQAVLAFNGKGYAQDHIENLSPTLRGGNTEGHANAGVPPAIAYAIQERAVCENPDAGPDADGVRADDCAYTMEARSVPQSVAFVQNSRSEVRLIGGDGQITGALAAELPAQQQNYVASGAQTMAVRRLMPVECERLQGFPDGWTLIPWKALSRFMKREARAGTLTDAGLRAYAATLPPPTDPAECPDGPRYKAIGNSMAVRCMAWIGGRIERHRHLPNALASVAAPSIEGFLG